MGVIKAHHIYLVANLLPFILKALTTTSKLGAFAELVTQPSLLILRICGPHTTQTWLLSVNTALFSSLISLYEILLVSHPRITIYHCNTLICHCPAPTRRKPHDFLSSVRELTIPHSVSSRTPIEKSGLMLFVDRSYLKTSNWSRIHYYQFKLDFGIQPCMWSEISLNGRIIALTWACQLDKRPQSKYIHIL